MSGFIVFVRRPISVMTTMIESDATDKERFTRLPFGDDDRFPVEVLAVFRFRLLQVLLAFDRRRSFSLGIGLCSHDRHFIGCRCDVAVLPIGEGKRDLGLPIACFARDPHGAVELTPSAAPVELNRDGNRISLEVLVWKFNSGYGMDVGRDTLAMF